MSKHHGALAVGIVTVTLAAGGGSLATASPALGAGSHAAAQASPVSTSVVATAAGKCPRGVKLPRGIDPRACGPIPRGAKRVKAIHVSEYGGGRTAVIVSPSGLTGCDLARRYSGCGSLGLISKPIKVNPIGDAYWWISLGSGRAKFGAKGDAPYFMYNQPKAQVVPYGGAVYYEKVACLSAKTGLTCWDSKTGHGLLISSTRAVTW